jgi:hypothetical protein
MKSSLIPPDDRATTPTDLDQALLLQLEKAVGKHFYAGCDRITQTILAQCQWSLTIHSDLPTLTIACPDAEIYWNIVSNMENISSYLSQLILTNRIKIIPMNQKNIYFEVEFGVG